MTASAAPVSGLTDRTRLRLPRLAPDRLDVVDAAFLVVLSALAMVGFHAAYGSSEYLVVAGVAFLLGLILAHITTRTRQPLLIVLGLTLLLYFLVGSGVALRGSGGGGALPTSHSLHSLASVSVHGWKQLLTSVRPVDNSDSLLVIPYLLGMTVAIAGFSVARRTRSSFAPVVAPMAVLVVSILFGSRHPTAAVAQGAVFGVVALGWAAARAARSRSAAIGASNPLIRLTSALVVLLVAFAAAGAIGPRLPFSQHHRVVITVQPPFDASAYPSPLAAFRQYTKNAVHSLYDDALLTEKGLPNGAFLQLAVLDAYDGSVWGTANGGSSTGADGFLRVGTMIPTRAPMTSPEHAVDVSIGSGYSQVWLPDASNLSHLRFTGSDAKVLQTSLRYNPATGTGIVPGGLHAGDSYSMTVASVLPVGLSALAGAAPGGAPIVPSDQTAAVAVAANAWSQGATTPIAAVQAIATHLYTAGYYSDGQDASGSAPGEATYRLVSFIQGREIVGDDEQYAAALALMANNEGVPARVVLGAVPQGGTVMGHDVRATVQLSLAGRGWVTLNPDAFIPPKTKLPKPLPLQVQKETTPKVVPPPLDTKPLTTDVTPNQSNADAHRPLAKHTGGALLPQAVVIALKAVGIPLLVLVLLAAAVVGIKRERRRRRRTHGSPAARVAGGWLELLDTVRELRHDLPLRATRREVAGALPMLNLAAAAAVADEAVFAAGDPDNAAAEAMWERVEAARREMLAPLGRLHRWRVAVSLRTLSLPKLPSISRPRVRLGRTKGLPA